jgi:Predicted membrane protein
MMGFAGCRTLWNMGFMGGGMWLSGIIFLLIVFAAIYLFSNNNRNHTNKTNALEILDQEYAKGNVSDDDYKKRKENLKN